MSCDAEFPEDFTPGKRARSPSRLLVPFGEKAPNAIADVAIDGPIRGDAGSVTEVGRPTRQEAVQLLAQLAAAFNTGSLSPPLDVAPRPSRARNNNKSG